MNKGWKMIVPATCYLSSWGEYTATARSLGKINGVMCAYFIVLQAANFIEVEKTGCNLVLISAIVEK